MGIELPARSSVLPVPWTGEPRRQPARMRSRGRGAADVLAPSVETLKLTAGNPSPTPESPDPPARTRWLTRGRRWLPPARLTWILLLVLGGYAVYHFGGLGLGSLIVLPTVAATVDLAFQSLRFPRVRVPDAALATGLFVALLLPPSVPLLAGGAVAFAAIGVKHALRRRGRPIVNPAATGVVLGVFLLGLAPAWWAGVDLVSEVAIVSFGILLIVRSPTTWRLPASFFLVYAPFSIFARVLLGAALAPKVLLLGVLDPATLFFGLYLVAEPRSAPRDPSLHPLYAALVAFGAALLPIVMPSAGILVALVIVGLGSGAIALASALRDSDPGERRTRRPASSRRTPRWTVGQRAATGFVVLFVIAFALVAGPASNPTPTTNLGFPPSHGGSGSGGGSSGGGGGGSGGGVTTASCTQDNPSIPSSTLSALHKALGPSVILSYDAGTGVTVFYDPVNQVTVTETDLYEDYGFAEFNGDDFTVSGCSP
jgi:NQR2, RnfD, RnfE family